MTMKIRLVVWESKNRENHERKIIEINDMPLWFDSNGRIVFVYGDTIELHVCAESEDIVFSFGQNWYTLEVKTIWRVDYPEQAIEAVC